MVRNSTGEHSPPPRKKARMFGLFEILFTEKLGCKFRMFGLFKKLFTVKLGCKVRMFGFFEKSFTKS